MLSTQELHRVNMGTCAASRQPGPTEHPPQLLQTYQQSVQPLVLTQTSASPLPGSQFHQPAENEEMKLDTQ